ncbi:conserved hypothetical protein [Thiobacillus denitrificans ATCC 25259]|uniref:ATPase AAA-type core domain-containing protein n=1 Tax=Thiobacillus denitrificans (strain ATCC 25259 / T1) TaxID=292415 RepID=Q3SFH4_THIDA|nr:AAA family ATPase [Thiobacillus denitrificans]AAZ98636.1 conserved hypothetical protein [Thiobacillus denitrificans ATCC 25259]
MQINRLTLTNFRGLTNSVLDFAPGFNLVVGVNGVGKTAVLEALRILLAKALPSFAEVRGFPGIGLTKDDITIDRKQAAIEVSFTHQAHTFSLLLSDQLEVVRDAVDEQKGLKDIRDIDELASLRHGQRPERGDPRLEGTLRGQTSERPRASGQLSPTPDRALKKSKPQPIVLYFSVRRAVPSPGTPKTKAGTPYQGIFEIERGLELGKIIEWWNSKATVAREAPDSRSAKQLTTTCNALERLLPHLSDWKVEDGNFTVCKVADVGVLNDESGEFEVKQETRRLPVQFLSDGERSLIAIGIDIAYRLASLNEDSETPLDDGEGIVLIDELDLHLHPQWQRTVVELLRTAFPKLQFICTTHSLFLIQSQRMGNLIQLDRIGDEEESAEQYHNQSIEDIAEEVQGIDLPQRSKRHVELMLAASEYYRALKKAEDDPNIPIEELKEKYEALSLRYSADPLVAAALDFRWETFVFKRNHATRR